MKKRITIRVDEDVLEWFKSQGKGYQSKMNEALRDCIRYDNPAVSAKSKTIKISTPVKRVQGDRQITDDYFKPIPKKGKKP